VIALPGSRERRRRTVVVDNDISSERTEAMSTTIATYRAGTAAVTGGVLWALQPVVFTTAHLEDTQHGTLSFAAVAVMYWVVGVLPLLLLLVGLSGLRRALGAGAGKLGALGIVVSGLALLAMFVGNGTEMTTITVDGTENDLGHFVFMIGFLVLVIGSLLLGIALLRSRRGPLCRWAGVLLVAMLPLGFGLAALGGIVSPSSDAGFWAAIALPTGIAWVLLGASLRSERRPALPEFAPAS
jgi:hypothetical protein